MKKAIVLLFLISVHCSGQNDKNFFVDAIEMMVRNNDGYYNINGLAIGNQILLNEESSLDLSMNYRISGNLGGLNTSSYKFKSHLIGGSLSYNFWTKEKRLRPFIGIALYTEIATNYKNELLRINAHKPDDRYSYGGGKYHARWYKGTPIVGNVFFGFNIKLIPSLYLKTAIGVGYERVRSISLTWIDGEVTNPLEDAEKLPTMINPIFSYNLQVGLTCAFSLKKSQEKNKR